MLHIQRSSFTTFTFKIERHQQLNHQTVIDKQSLEAQFDMILIEGAGGIAVPIYDTDDNRFN